MSCAKRVVDMLCQVSRHGGLAGGGVRGGYVHGASDDFGFRAVTDRMHVHDLHATILYLLGMDHTKLTYFFNGRNMRLTDVAGELIPQIVG